MSFSNLIQTRYPISASSLRNGIVKTSEWSDEDQLRLECYVDILNKKSDTYLEELTGGVPSKTVTQVARRCLSLGGKYNFVNPAGKDGSSWSEVERNSFYIGLAHFGAGNWEDITKYCVKTKTVSQVAEYGRGHLTNRPMAFGINNIDVTPQRAYQWMTVGTSSGSSRSSEDPLITGLHSVPSGSAFTGLGQSAILDARMPSYKRQRDVTYSGGITLSSGQSSNRPGTGHQSTGIPPLMASLGTAPVITSTGQSNAEDLWGPIPSRPPHPVSLPCGENGTYSGGITLSSGQSFNRPGTGLRRTEIPPLMAIRGTDSVITSTGQSNVEDQWGPLPSRPPHPLSLPCGDNGTYSGGITLSSGQPSNRSGTGHQNSEMPPLMASPVTDSVIISNGKPNIEDLWGPIPSRPSRPVSVTYGHNETYSESITLCSGQSSNRPGTGHQSTEMPILMASLGTDSVTASTGQSNFEDLWGPIPSLPSSPESLPYGENGHNLFNELNQSVSSEESASMRRPLGQFPELNGGSVMNGQSEGMVTYAEDNSSLLLGSENNQFNGLMDGTEDLSELLFHGGLSGQPHQF